MAVVTHSSGGDATVAPAPGLNMKSPWLGFRVDAKDPETSARAGVLATPRGDIPTPVFMPVGTAGTVKAVDPDTLAALGAKICLGNTYHLLNRPGPELVRQLARQLGSRTAV